MIWHALCIRAGVALRKPKPKLSPMAALAEQLAEMQRLVEELAQLIRYKPDLYLKDVLRLTGWSKSTLYRKLEAKLFPQPDTATGRPRWRMADILEKTGRTDPPDKEGRNLAGHAVRVSIAFSSGSDGASC